MLERQRFKWICQADPLGQEAVGLAARDTGEWRRCVVAGHANYFAVPGSMHRVGQFYCGAIKHWLHAIRRRRQKGRAAWPWERFRCLVEGTIPRPRTVHPFPDARFAARLKARAV